MGPKSTGFIECTATWPMKLIILTIAQHKHTRWTMIEWNWMETSEPMNESYNTFFLRILFSVHSPNENVFVFDMVKGKDDSNLH